MVSFRTQQAQRLKSYCLWLIEGIVGYLTVVAVDYLLQSQHRSVVIPDEVVPTLR